MLTKQSLLNTFNLINSANISVILSNDYKIAYNLARSLLCHHFKNTQYYPPKTSAEITNNIKELLSQYESEYNTKSELLILNLYQISSEIDYKSFSKMLLELNELSEIENLKILVLLTNKSISLLEKVYSTFKTEQQSQILLLTMSTEKPISITVETGDSKGANIFYEFDNEVELLKEVN